MADRDWSEWENDLIVADYFSMLRDDIVGKAYNKASHNRTLQEKLGRSRGSIEFKHQNISAALQSLGQCWIFGYKPRFNFQESLSDAIVRWLDKYPDWLAPKDYGQTSPQESYLQEERPIYFEAPPTHSNATPPKEIEKMMDIARRYNVAAREEQNRVLGRAGENAVLRHERSFLQRQGRPDLADNVCWVSDEVGDGAGYDISSFQPDGQPRLIEVKTTNGWERTPFHISRNELEVSRQYKDHWFLVRLWNFARAPRAFQLRPPIESYVELTPTTFQAAFP